MSQDKEQKLISHIQNSLDQSVDELDAVTLARLRAARQTALQSRDRPPIWQNKLALASALSVTLAVGMWVNQKKPDNDVAIEDLQILSSSDDLELYKELEFYQWLIYQNEQG